MEFADKYISAADAFIDNKDNKIVLSDDAYAIGEIIGELIKKLEHLRISSLK